MQENCRPDLCLRFLGWQCRVRQDAMRRQGGKPPPGTRARLQLDGQYLGQINTVMHLLNPIKATAEFRFMVQKTHDPRAVYHNALKLLGESYYRDPAQFDDRLAALFASDSEWVDRIQEARQCRLEFFQGNRWYKLCGIGKDCEPGSTAYEATYWHNHLFNPQLPGRVRVLRFEIDWSRSEDGEGTLEGAGF